MARWASWMVLVALIGSTSAAFAQPFPPPQRPPRPPPLQVAPPADMRAPPRQFARAVDSFAIATRRISTNSTPPTDRDLGYAIELFARALESAPYAQAIGGSKAASDMRAALRIGSLAGPPGSPEAQQALDNAMYIGTDALLALAYGPYGDSRVVGSQAWELENFLYNRTYDQQPTNDNERVSIVLQQSAFLLKTIRDMGNAPPPQPRPPPSRPYPW